MKRIACAIASLSMSVAALLADSFDVNITAAGNSSALLTAIGYGNVDRVTQLTVSGTMNGYDFMVLRNKLPNLSILDLSHCSIVSNDYPYYEDILVEKDVFPAYLFMSCGISDMLTSVKLPQSVTSVGTSAFRGCSKLASVELGDNITEIGSYAFSGCSSLTSVHLPLSLEYLRPWCFGSCSRLQSVNFPSQLQIIEENSFRDCIQLKSVVLSGRLRRIDKSAFYNCREMILLQLSNRITSLGDQAFQGCAKISEVNLPSSLESLGANAFKDCSSLRKVGAYSAQPVKMNQNTFPPEIFDVCTLYVPKASFNAYFWDTQWSQFANLVAQDFIYENLYITYDGKDFILDESTGKISGTPEIAILGRAGLIVNDAIGQQASELILLTDGKQSGSVLAENNLTATNFTMQLEANANVWYYFSLPFDASMSAVRCAGNWVIRTYDGQQRALHHTGWVPLTGNTLKAGKGYIFQTDTRGPLYITMEHPVFEGNDVSLPVSRYLSTSDVDASWNYLGNPLPAYYCIADLGFSAPITVRNIGTGAYEAYNPNDDTYHLAPFQAFFVQKPESENRITFSSDKRRTYVMSQNDDYLSAPAMREVQSSRLLVDVTLSDASGVLSDRTRLVYDDQQTCDYDLGHDAHKMLNGEALMQLYTLERQVPYAINERPLSGEVALAYSVSQPGVYELRQSRGEMPVVLYDTQTGSRVRLDEAPYRFSSEQGTFEERFRLSPFTSAIDELKTESATPFAYDLYGRRAEERQRGGCTVLVGQDAKLKTIVR